MFVASGSVASGSLASGSVLHSKFMNGMIRSPKRLFNRGTPVFLIRETLMVGRGIPDVTWETMRAKGDGDAPSRTRVHNNRGPVLFVDHGDKAIEIDRTAKTTTTDWAER